MSPDQCLGELPAVGWVSCAGWALLWCLDFLNLPAALCD